jgi:hypothetical protein
MFCGERTHEEENLEGRKLSPIQNGSIYPLGIRTIFESNLSTRQILLDPPYHGRGQNAMKFTILDVVCLYFNNMEYIESKPTSLVKQLITSLEGTVAPISLPPTTLQTVNLERPLRILVVARHICHF